MDDPPTTTLHLGLGLEGDPGPILWDPSSPAADHETFPRKPPSPLCFFLPASLSLRINAAVTAAVRSPRAEINSPGSAGGVDHGG